MIGLKTFGTCGSRLARCHFLSFIGSILYKKITSHFLNLSGNLLSVIVLFIAFVMKDQWLLRDCCSFVAEILVDNFLTFKFNVKLLFELHLEKNL